MLKNSVRYVHQMAIYMVCNVFLFFLIANRNLLSGYPTYLCLLVIISMSQCARTEPVLAFRCCNMFGRLTLSVGGDGVECEAAQVSEAFRSQQIKNAKCCFL